MYRALPTAKSLSRSPQASWPGPRQFLEGLIELRSKCQPQREPLSVVTVDVDKFHQCNERHSPAFGDRVLDQIATAVREACRPGDVWARDAADRFLLALPGMTEVEAKSAVRLILKSIHLHPVRVGDLIYPTLVSCGIAAAQPGGLETEHRLIKRSATALHYAKRQGGRCTVLWSKINTIVPSHRPGDDPGIAEVTLWGQRIREQLHHAREESTRALVAAVEAKDPFTVRHSDNVARFSEQIAKRLSVAPRQLETLRRAATLHDVGKLGIPDAILQKPGPLTDEEFECIRRHPRIGTDILSHVSHLSDELPLILQHHERYDGTGYPAGLKKDEIFFGARVLAVADALDAMLSRRSYKEPYPIDRAIHELRTGANHQFDPVVASTAVDWLEHSPPDM